MGNHYLVPIKARFAHPDSEFILPLSSAITRVFTIFGASSMFQKLKKLFNNFTEKYEFQEACLQLVEICKRHSGSNFASNGITHARFDFSLIF